jgi:NADPH:quinone reductase-like Zn-dependent oxidoreductase
VWVPDEGSEALRHRQILRPAADARYKKPASRGFYFDQRRLRVGMVKHLRLHGVSIGSRSGMEELLAFVENHRLSPIIDARYSFDALPDALDHLDRGPFGKVVVEIN